MILTTWLLCQHSQKHSVPPAKSWVVVKQNGPVVCAHCSCMAGLWEACSHIAALLFTRMVNNTSSTTLLCSWLPPSFQSVPYVELFLQLHILKGGKRMALVLYRSSNYGSMNVRKMVTQEQLNSLSCALSAAGRPVILLITPKISRFFHFSVHERNHPKTIGWPLQPYILGVVNVNLYLTILHHSWNVEKHTQGQSRPKVWFQQYAGQVTVSTLKAAVCTKMSQPSVINQMTALSRK